MGTADVEDHLIPHSSRDEGPPLRCFLLPLPEFLIASVQLLENGVFPIPLLLEKGRCPGIKTVVTLLGESVMDARHEEGRSRHELDRGPLHRHLRKQGVVQQV